MGSLEGNSMGKLRLFPSIAIAVFTLFVLSSTSLSFHSGSAVECDGCHEMHNSASEPDAASNGATTDQTPLRLLKGSDASSTCLNCHEAAGLMGPTGHYISTPSSEVTAGMPPKQLSPGGDFGWLKRSYTFSKNGIAVVEDGSSHGHNIVAIDKGYTTVSGTSPGGSYPASMLGCTSCHDPHGIARQPSTGEAVGAYRLLAGRNYVSGPVTFQTYPIAVAPLTYNQSEAANQVRVAYGASGTNTWSNWCGTCHGTMLSGQNYVHPVDRSLGSKIAANYNAYLRSGNVTGSGTNSFLSLLPFATNTGDIATLAALANNNNSNLNGPNANDQVNCLTCHRAHASGWKHALRWNNSATFIVEKGVWPTAQGRTVEETRKAYYDRPPTVFASYQRVLCNKCHMKD
jgi:hypothetical protein